MVGLPGLDLNFPFMKELVASVVGVSGFAYTCYRVGRRAGNAGDKALLQQVTTENERFKTRLHSLETVIKDPQDFWLRSPAHESLAANQAALNSSIPVVCVVNFKGGVGKTTICANLAAYFAQMGKRVLLIDFDYQGSLSDTVLSHARVEKFKTNAHDLLQSSHNPAELRGTAERLSSINSNLWIYPAFYGFSRAEIQMMFRWLVGQDQEIRFNLSNYLQSAPFKPEAESGFDMVLIDAPPRLLTGVVNALAASTDVLIPTILDGQSHIATLNTITAVAQFRQKLNPGLRMLGVVPSMVSKATGYNQRELHFLNELERQMPEHFDSPVQILKGRPICRREELAKAGGSEILYEQDTSAAPVQEIRTMFATLGKYVHDNVRWRRTEPVGTVMAGPAGTRLRVAQ